jgi:hypothetical protein
MNVLPAIRFSCTIYFPNMRKYVHIMVVEISTISHILRVTETVGEGVTTLSGTKNLLVHTNISIRLFTFKLHMERLNWKV